MRRTLDKTFRALAEPIRRQILQALRAGDLTAGEIAAQFDVTAPTISHHLAVLRQAGLVDVERDGRNQIYALNSTVFQEFVEEMMNFFGKGDQE